MAISVTIIIQFLLIKDFIYSYNVYWPSPLPISFFSIPSLPWLLFPPNFMCSIFLKLWIPLSAASMNITHVGPYPGAWLPYQEQHHWLGVGFLNFFLLLAGMFSDLVWYKFYPGCPNYCSFIFATTLIYPGDTASL